MRKLISVLLAFAMIFMLAVPCFAQGAATFSVKVISETDTAAIVSVDFEGGTAFNCFDLEMTYNKEKLEATEAYDGDGLDAFVREAKKTEGAVTASTINKDTNPIKDSMAITSPFRVVNGKDIFVAKFNKLTADKITGDDIKVTFSNCATMDEKIQVTVSNMINDGSAASINVIGSAEQADGADKSIGAKSDSKAGAENAEKADGENNPDGSAEKKVKNKKEKKVKTAAEKIETTKKIIIAVAAAICVVFVAAACWYASKKSKKKKK